MSDGTCRKQKSGATASVPRTFRCLFGYFKQRNLHPRDPDSSLFDAAIPTANAPEQANLEGAKPEGGDEPQFPALVLARVPLLFK